MLTALIAQSRGQNREKPKKVKNGAAPRLLYQTALIPKMRKVQLACVKGPHLIRENSDPSRLSLSRLERCLPRPFCRQPTPALSHCATFGYLDVRF